MADQKLTDRTELTVFENADLVHIVDASDLTDGADGTSKKIKAVTLLNDNVSSKKWVIFGDSFSNSLTSDYPKEVIDLLGLTGTVTHALSGNKYSDQIVILDALILGDASYFTAFDICSIHLGVNDYALSVALGGMDDVAGTATIVGQAKYMIETILASNPDIELYIITPTEANTAPVPYKGLNAGGYKLETLSQTLVKVANVMGIKSIDLNSLSQFNLQTIPTYTYDLLHPDQAGKDVISKIVANSFKGKNTNGNAFPTDGKFSELAVAQGANSTPTVFEVENTNEYLISGEDLGQLVFRTNDGSTIGVGNGVAGSIRSVLEDAGFWYALAFNVKNAASEFEAMRIKYNGDIITVSNINIGGNLELANLKGLQLKAGNVSSFIDIDFPEITSAGGTIRIGRSTNTTGTVQTQFFDNINANITLNHSTGKINAIDCNFSGLPTYADDTAAGGGGASSGDLYQTAAGEMRIKL